MFGWYTEQKHHAYGEEMKYCFEQITFDELVSYRTSLFHMSTWKCINVGYEQGCYKVIGNNHLVALLCVDESASSRTIVFEVQERHRNQGIGRNIISQYLSDNPGKYNIFPHDDEVVAFWEKCGFYGNKHEMWFENDEV